MSEFATESESSLDEALLATLVQEFQTNLTTYLGRTAIQKLTYFAKVLGVPFTYRFRIYYYGPYSEDLAYDADSLLVSGVLTDTSADSNRYSSFKLGRRADQVLDKYRKPVEQQRPVISRVVKTLGKLEPNDLELLSTLHFVDKSLKAGGNQNPSRADVIQAFKRVKGDKFSTDDVTSAYDAMQEVELVGRPA